MSEVFLHSRPCRSPGGAEMVLLLSLPALAREFFIDNLLVRIRFIIVMIRWTGLAPWECEFSFPGSLTSTALVIVAAVIFVPPP